MGEVEHLAVIGDVHADWAALSAVAEQIAAAGITRILCLGDWASGGPNPAQCFDWVTAHCEIVLAGNHELFILGRVWEHETAPWALAAEQAHTELGAARVARLRDFDAYVRTPYAELVHGDAHRPDLRPHHHPRRRGAQPHAARRARHALRPHPPGGALADPGRLTTPPATTAPHRRPDRA
jgi:hypothetical protein